MPGDSYGEVDRHRGDELSRTGDRRGVAQRRSSVPARPDAPMLPGGSLTFTDLADRDTCWRRLGPATRQRLEDLAGTSLEWWARETDVDASRPIEGHIYGTEGYAVADPRLNSQHRPVSVVSAYLFEAGSARNLTVTTRPAAPSRSRSGGSSGSSAPGRPPSSAPPRPRLVPGLDDYCANIIGTLPPKAQQALLDPFVAGESLLRCDVYYHGEAHDLKVFAVVAAGPRTVTSTIGTRVIPVGHDEATAHWDLACRRATVAKRIGR